MYAQWRLAQATHLVLSAGSIQYAFQPLALANGYKFSRACRVLWVAVSRYSSSKNHTKRRMERAKLHFLFRTNHLPRLNASTRLLIKSHMVMRPFARLWRDVNNVVLWTRSAYHCPLYKPKFMFFRSKIRFFLFSRQNAFAPTGHWRENPEQIQK